MVKPGGLLVIIDLKRENYCRGRGKILLGLLLIGIGLTTWVNRGIGGEFFGPVLGGYLPVGLTECSGLAISRRDPRILWAHNDHGGPVIFAMETNGTLRGNVRIEGVKNYDWEDMASFVLNGCSYLLIADTGDNKGIRKDCSLIVIEEPKTEELSTVKELVAKIAWRVSLIFPKEPRDCEAVAVDITEEMVYLFSKRGYPPDVYVIPLRPKSERTPTTARHVGTVPKVPQPGFLRKMQPLPTGRFRGQLTGADFSADGRRGALLSYGDVLLFKREKNERWEDAFFKKPEILKPHGLKQAEGVAFNQEGTVIYVTSEGAGSGVLRYQERK